MNKFLFASSILLIFLIVGCVSKATLVKVDSRSGVTQGFIHIMPKDPPVASVILYAGSGGNLRLTSASTMKWGEWNFLVRTRHQFAAHGFQVAVIDTPVDKWGHMSLNRGSKEHITDSKAVAAFLRSQANVPVWIVGTSRGTDSATNLATNSNGAFDGVVFTSSIQDIKYLYDLKKVKMPALVVHNKLDECGVCPPSEAEEIYKKMVNSKNRKLVWFSSTETKNYNACEAMTPHGFLGIESQVVKAIAGFIKAN